MKQPRHCGSEAAKALWESRQKKKKKQEKTVTDDVDDDKKNTAAPEEGSDEYWNEQRAKLGLKPLK